MYRASDGYLLHFRHWSAARPTPRAHIVALHGIQSHAGWYTYSSRRLAAAGYEVTFLDRRGSGLNRAARGHAIHEERLINDVVQFLTSLHDEQRRAGTVLPVLLMGVSWGGKLAAAVALRRPDLLSAVALLYPGIFPQVQPGWWDRWKLLAAEARGWGHVRIPIPLNEPSRFTHEPTWQEFIRRDELALHRVTVSFLRANLRLTELIARQTEPLEMPLLVMLSGRDDIIDNARTHRWLHRQRPERSTLIEYPAARHTLEFEPNPEAFIDDLLRWLERTVADFSPRPP